VTVSIFWGLAAGERVLRIQDLQRAQDGGPAKPFSLQGAWREIGRAAASQPTVASPAADAGSDHVAESRTGGETRSEPLDLTQAGPDAARHAPLPIDAPAPKIVEDRAGQAVIIARADTTPEHRPKYAIGERETASAAIPAAPTGAPDTGDRTLPATDTHPGLVSAEIDAPLAGATIAAMTRTMPLPLTTAAIEAIVALPVPAPQPPAPHAEGWPQLLTPPPLPPEDTTAKRARTTPEAPQRVVAPAPAPTPPTPRAKPTVKKAAQQAPKAKPAAGIGSSMFEAMRRAAP
jgi:hypothetical protein